MNSTTTRCCQWWASWSKQGKGTNEWSKNSTHTRCPQILTTATSIVQSLSSVSHSRGTYKCIIRLGNKQRTKKMSNQFGKSSNNKKDSNIYSKIKSNSPIEWPIPTSSVAHVATNSLRKNSPSTVESQTFTKSTNPWGSTLPTSRS